MGHEETGAADELRLISIPEACERLSIRHWSIYRLINEKSLKTVKIGARRLISLRDLNDFIETLRKDREG